MIKHIRIATAEEIDKIRDKSDLMPGHTQILALDSDAGGADLAVVRNCVEINPVIYAEGTNDVRRSRFLYALEERLLGAGIDRYYTQIPAADGHYLKVAKNWGFEEVSTSPEIRVLKVIK